MKEGGYSPQIVDARILPPCMYYIQVDALRAFHVMARTMLYVIQAVCGTMASHDVWAAILYCDEPHTSLHGIHIHHCKFGLVISLHENWFLYIKKNTFKHNMQALSFHN